MKIILIMGLPGSGKTTLASELAPLINAKRMADLAKKTKEEGHYVVADFICPTPEARSLFPADYIIWVDTIKEGRFEDTNQMFVKPEKYNFHVTTQDAKLWASKIAEDLK